MSLSTCQDLWRQGQKNFTTKLGRSLFVRPRTEMFHAIISHMRFSFHTKIGCYLKKSCNPLGFVHSPSTRGEGGGGCICCDFRKLLCGAASTERGRAAEEGREGGRRLPRLVARLRSKAILLPLPPSLPFLHSSSSSSSFLFVPDLACSPRLVGCSCLNGGWLPWRNSYLVM